jgi:putative transposase
MIDFKGCPKKRYRTTTKNNPSHRVADNLLEQDFVTNGPNQKWASDITYISTHQGWLYLAVTMDLFSRKIIGWSMGHWISRHLVVDALRMAINVRQPKGSLIHHSDRGAQYSSADFRDELKKHGIIPSMSGTGNCYDNAVVESFFAILKRERVNRVRYRTREEARADLFEFIEILYNRKRRHGYLGNISPENFETRKTGSF